MNREYTFKEWVELTDSERGEIRHHRWNPFNPSGEGLATREAIAAEFRRQFPDYGGPQAEVGYFDKEGWCLVSIVKESATRVPAKFAGLRIVKAVEQSDGSLKWVRM